MLPIVNITPRELELEAEVRRLRHELAQARKERDDARTGWPEWFKWFW